MCFFGGGGNGSSAVMQQAAIARADENERQRRIDSAVGAINNDFSRFNDAFYQGRADAYTAYSMPQLEDQYNEQKRQLTYALSRGGLLNSSVAAERQAALQAEYDKQKQAITDQGMSLSSQSRTDVENARSSLIGQAQSAADPGSIASTAGQQVDVLSTAQSFSPLAQLFTNVAGTLASATRPTADAVIAGEKSRQSNIYGTPSLSRQEKVR